MKMGIEWCFFFPMVFNHTTLKNVTLPVQAGLFWVFPESTNADTDYRIFQHTHVTFCMRVPTGDSCTVTPTLRFSSQIIMCRLSGESQGGRNGHPSVW